MKLYTRDSVTWTLWGHEGQALFMALLRKFDLAGVIDIGGNAPSRAVAALLGWPVPFVELGLAALLDSGTVEVGDRALVMPNYLHAQEARSSDAQRQRSTRERRAANKRVTNRDETVTPRHTASHPVTPRGEERRQEERRGEEKAESPTQKRSSTRPLKSTSQDAISAAQYLYDAIKAHTPGFMADAKPAAVASKLGAWARDVDVGMRQDGMTLQGCRQAVDAAHGPSDAFWHSNLLSGKKLRKHYETLRIKRKGPASANGAPIDYGAIDYHAIGDRLDEICGTKK